MKTTQSKAPQVTAQSTTKKAHKDIDFKTHNTQHTQNQIDTTQQPDTKDFNSKNPNPITKKTNDNSETTLQNDTQTVHFHDKQSSTSTVSTSTNQSPSEITTSDISNNTTPTIKTPTTSNNNNNPTTITGTFSAGKYIEGDTNSIKVYKADGSSTLIGTGSFNDNGQITITLTGTNANYTGAVYIKLTKTGISHQDELNGTEALDSDLFAVAYLNSGANTINITVRSSIAAKILGVDKTTTAITLNETDINKCNEEVNAAFGLSGSAIDTNVDTINSSGDESNTLAKQAGQVAAALSGMRNTTATNTFEKVIEQIADVIANNGALNKATSTALATGAIAVQAQAQANKAIATADIDETHAGSAAAALKIAEDAVTTAGTTATNAQKQALATAQEAYNKAVSANQEATSFVKLATNTVTHFNNLIIPISNITISNNTGVVSFITNDSTLTISATLDNALSTGKKLWGSIDNGETWTDISTTNTDIIWSNDNKTIAWRQTLTADTNSSVQFAITKTLTTTTATPSEIKGDIDGGIASHNYIYDSSAPVFDTSNASTIDIPQNENLEATVIYIAVTTDANAVTYKLSGTDADKFSIDKNSGEIKYNAKQPTVSEGTTATHHITITATDAAGNASNKNIVINLENPFTIAVPQAFNSRSVVTVVAQGFVMNGENVEDYSGFSVSSAGDVNGDGLDDVIVGAFGADPASGDKAGKSFVVFGKTNATAINLSNIASGTGGFVINGENFEDNSGRSVSSAGDINGDGLDDLIVGAWLADPTDNNSNKGKSYVVLGKTSTTAVNLSTIVSGTGGFVINGENAGDSSGFSVSSAGDINGDGLDDLIVGAFYADSTGLVNVGKSYVVFGKTNTDVINLSKIALGTGGFVINGENAKDYNGYSVSSAGDINGDGLDDLIIGAYGADLADKEQIGKSYVVFSKTNTTTINLSDIASGTGGFVISGENSEDNSGYSVSSAGDINGDGLDDLIVGAYMANLADKSLVGNSYVVFGKANTTAVNLSDIAFGMGGFVINGENRGDFSGISVSSAGDINGDGLDDLIVGASGAASAGQFWVGKSFVVFGKTNTTAIRLSDIVAGTGGFVINGENAYDYSGHSVSSAGDINGDGLDDLIVGSYGADVGSHGENPDGEPAGKSDVGKSYVIFGKTDTKAINLSDISAGRGTTAHTIDFQGDTNTDKNDTLTGTSANELFVAGLGDDILTGNGGTDVFNAGAGNDTIIINGDNLAQLYSNKLSSNLLARVDGGGNTDTLKLDGNNLILNLAEIDNGRIQDIEIINLGTGGNTLKLKLNDLLDLSSETNTLKVIGNSNANVEAIGFEKSNTSKTVDGITYQVYSHTDAPTAKLWVQQNLIVSTSIAQGFVMNNGENTENTEDYDSPVSSAGDVNGDGLDDLIVGADWVGHGKSWAGKSYVVFGKTNATAINLSDIASNSDTGGFVINGEENGDLSGYSVSSAGDVNGDGLDDLIVGAYGADPASKSWAGKSYVVFGKTNATAINLSDIASNSDTGGFVINGENRGDRSGVSVSSAGDVNGDGLDDLIVGAYGADPASKSAAGKSYVVFGKTNATAINLSDIASNSGTGGFVINGENEGDRSGVSVSSAGDINGDGLDDLIVGTSGADSASKSKAGKSYVVFGKTNATAINLSDIASNSGTGGFVINGENAEDYSGFSVSSAGDINGDGLDDLIIGASGADPAGKSWAGKSYVVFGKTNATAINLSDIASNSGTGGFVINGEEAVYSGHSVSSAGDINGDGLDDLIIGAYMANFAGEYWAGKSYVVFGKTNATAINLSDIASNSDTGGFVINGEENGDLSGYSVSSAGDVNGDGLDDLIVGTNWMDFLSMGPTKKSYVIFGKTDTKAINLSDISAGKGTTAHTIDFQGDTNTDKNDTLTGTSANELFVAGLDDDILTGNGGTDVFNAGAGNDTIIINGDNLAQLYSNKLSSNLLARVDGGGNTDTLKLDGNNLILNLAEIDNGRIQDIEIINLGTGGNTLKLKLNDLLDLSSETNTLKVIGNSNANVEAIGFEKSNTSKTVDGITYQVYSHTDAPTAKLWVQQNLIVSTSIAQGFVMNGENAYDYSGRSVSSAGDVNGDGLDDLIVGAYKADPVGKSKAGKSYVVFGKTNATAINLSDIASNSGTGGFVINGENAEDYSGYSVSSAGDVNGDGLDDLIVGAYKADPAGKSKAGKSFVVFGTTDTTAINLSTIAAGTGGFVINGENANDQIGISVSSAGDVNGDGLDDLIIGAPEANNETGKSYVVFGATNTTAINLSTIATGTGGFVINGENRDDQSGISVSSAGDVNGDGLDDLIVGTPGASNETGKSYVVFGTIDTTAINLSTIAAGTGGFVINGENEDDQSGISVSSAGDVNGDGLDDLIVGAFWASLTGSANIGKSYVVFGTTDTTAINLSTIVAGTGGFVINGENTGDNSGYSVSSAGDVNGDGLDDVIVGAAQADSASNSKVGKSFVVFGKADEIAINLSNIVAGIGGFVIYGGDAWNQSGASVSSAGDVNGDGLDDLIVGAHKADPTSGANAGKSYVVFGKTDTTAVNLANVNAGKGIVAHTIDFQGDIHVNKNDMLVGTFANELFVSGLGDDILRGNGGTDVFNAGTGNDTIIINGDNLDKLYSNKLSDDLLARVDGGGNTDTLKLEGNNLSLNLTKIDNSRIQDIEIIDLSLSSNTLKLSSNDLLDLSSETNILKVIGDSGANVEAVGFEKSNIDKTVDGVTYQVYSHTDTPTAKLWVQQNLIVSTSIAQGFVMNGENTGDYSGFSVSSAGDVNGDGLDDLIVGAYRADSAGGNKAGKSFVIFGKTSATAVDLSEIASGSSTGGFVINGENANDKSGYSVSSAGDVNGDGLDDLIVGTYWENSTSSVNAGKSFVVFGTTATTAINLSTIAFGTGGFVINGENANDNIGTSVSSAGDVNGDGLDDLIIGTNTNKSFVVFGTTATTAINLSTIAAGTGGFVINEENGMNFGGYLVSSAGDVNGDGLDDLIIGSFYTDIIITHTNAAKSYVVFGKKNDTTAIDLSVIVSGTGGFVINGESAYNNNGNSVSSAGDVNGDGLDDLIIGDYRADPTSGISAGKSYVVFGKSSKTAIDLSAIAAGTGGFVINGEMAHDSGRSVSSAGDVNGDGLDDLIVGADQIDSAGNDTASKAFVVFGKTDTTAVNLSAIAAGTGGFVINGENAWNQNGISVSSAGDINGDGLDDLIVGAYWADPVGHADAGKSFVVFGKTDTQAIDLMDINNINNDKRIISHEIDLQGDTYYDNKDDTLVGTFANELFVAGIGDDILIGNGGTDVFNAGAGNDTIIINANNLSKLYSNKLSGDLLARIDGGSNTDTLKLEGSNLNLNLAKIDNGRIQDIEIIDLTGSGNNSLDLNLSDLLDISSETNVLKIIGDTGDTVNIQHGIYDFMMGPSATEDGVTYNVYSNSKATTAELWIDQDLNVI